MKSSNSLKSGQRGKNVPWQLPLIKHFSQLIAGHFACNPWSPPIKLLTISLLSLQMGKLIVIKVKVVY